MGCTRTTDGIYRTEEDAMPYAPDVITARTKYIGATDTEPGKIRVSRKDGGAWRVLGDAPYDYTSADPQEAHMHALLPWFNVTAEGVELLTTPREDGYIFDITMP